MQSIKTFKYGFFFRLLVMVIPFSTSTIAWKLFFSIEAWTLDFFKKKSINILCAKLFLKKVAIKKDKTSLDRASLLLNQCPVSASNTAPLFLCCIVCRIHQLDISCEDKGHFNESKTRIPLMLNAQFSLHCIRDTNSLNRLLQTVIMIVCLGCQLLSLCCQ